jgi:hypothetical protein
MEKHVVIRVGTFAERLAELASPVPEPVHVAMVGLLGAEATRLGQNERDRIHGEHATASEAESQAKANLEATQAAKADLAARVAQARFGWVSTLVVGILMLVCAAATFASEFVLARAVIPWLLSVSPRSLLGLALSLAPAVGGLILDRVMFALFDVDDAWETLSTMPSRFERGSRRAIRIAFFTIVGLLTVYAAYLLADARAIASLVKMNESASISSAQQVLIDSALRVLAIALCINGGLFYLFGVQELRKAGKLWRTDRSLKKAERDESAAREGYAEVEAKRRQSELMWQEVDERANAVANNYRADGMVQLAIAVARPQPLRSAREVVAGRLNVQVAAATAAA